MTTMTEVDCERLRLIVREELRDELRQDYLRRIKELEECLEWLLQHGWRSAKVMQILKKHL
jgi:hypothetical protein